MAGDAQRTWSAWLRGVASCGLLALGVALPVWGVARVVSVLAPVLVAVALAATVAVLTADRAASAEGERLAGRPPARRAGLTWWGLVVAGCGSAVLCAAVAAAVAPGLVLLWLAALGLTMPPVRAHLLRRLRPAPPSAGPRERAPGGSRPGPAGTGTTASPSAGAPRPGTSYDPRCSYRRVSDLATAELCHLWRVTYWAVRDTRSPARTVHVVQLRHAVLDELEKRHPDAVARWLGSGHHGADGPARYL